MILHGGENALSGFEIVELSLVKVAARRRRVSVRKRCRWRGRNSIWHDFEHLFFAGRDCSNAVKRVTVKIQGGANLGGMLRRGFERRMWSIEHETQRVWALAGKIGPLTKRVGASATILVMVTIVRQARTGKREAATWDSLPPKGWRRWVVVPEFWRRVSVFRRVRSLVAA